MMVDAKIAWRAEGDRWNAYLCRLDGSSTILVLSVPRMIVTQDPTFFDGLKVDLAQWFVRRIRDVAPESDPKLIAVPPEPGGKPS